MKTVWNIALISGCLSLAPALGQNVRIVDFGADMGWGELTYRGKSAERGQSPTVYRDGDGSTTNDYVSYWPFSLTEPLNPPGLRYDTDQKNAVFYGGLTLYSCNPADPSRPRAISEGHMNANHDFRDDLNFMGGLENHGPKEQVEAYGVWFWQKTNFLNGGNVRSVSFNKDSMIAVHVSRYWVGLHAGRWMVRDGEQFYLSKKTWANSYRAFGLEASKPGDNPVVHTTHILNPNTTEWAEYHPQAPYQIDFDHTKADFKPHAFRNVTAVGFFVNRDLSAPVKVAGGLRPPFALKWNAFRCDAVVDRKDEDYLVAMKPVPGADKRVAFLMSESEISFQQWQAVWRSSVGNQYCPSLGNLGYSFDRDGAMGSMRADGAAHTPREPVTDITLTDAAAFCNALSELEGFVPAYYADPDFKIPLRRTVDRDMRENWGKHAAVYWNRAANGYRLPTETEWIFAAAGGADTPLSSAEQSSWTKKTADGRTHEVGASKPNRYGLFDLLGNVWEYIWPVAADTLDVDSLPEIQVLGGSYSYPDDPATGSITPYPEQPMRGHYAIGFRVVRNGRNGAAKTVGGVEVPRWTIEKAHSIPSLNPMSAKDLTALLRTNLPLVKVNAGLANERDEMDPEVVKEKNNAIALAQNNRFLKKITPEEAEAIITANTICIPRNAYPALIGKTEVPYDLWKTIKGWAEANGYQFNYSGDMGSMRHATDRNYSYEQREPVTGISWYDAIVWCNAASELLGREPVYYADLQRTRIYKTALWFRLDMFAGQGTPKFPWEPLKGKDSRQQTGSGDRIYMRAKADGFRLPLDIEFNAANKQPSVAEVNEEWTAANANDKSHPVGEKEAYAHGLCDMNGNVFEWAWDSERVNYEFQNASYVINGNGYFYESYDRTKPRSPTKTWSFSEYTATARSFVGFRIMCGENH